MRKTSKKTKTTTAQSVYTAFNFYLTNGEWFALLTFAGEAQVRKLFKGCKIKGDSVYLA
jgi:hypothetical protein